MTVDEAVNILGADRVVELLDQAATPGLPNDTFDVAAAHATGDKARALQTLSRAQRRGTLAVADDSKVKFAAMLEASLILAYEEGSQMALAELQRRGVEAPELALVEEADYQSVATVAPQVPIGANGLEGWSSCCKAAVTYCTDPQMEGGQTLCCKQCFEAVESVYLEGDVGVRLGEVVQSVIAGSLTADEGVAMQDAMWQPDPGDA